MVSAPETALLDVKTCPRCAEQVKLAARVCRYCGAEFVLTRRGYCARCHQLADVADDALTCPRCASTLIDIHLDSQLVERPAAPLTPPFGAGWSAPTAPSSLAVAPTGFTVGPPGAPAPVGRLRAALAGSLRHVIGFNLATASALLLGALPVLGQAFESLRVYQRGGPVFIEAAALGPIFIVFAAVILLAVPRRVLPRRIGGSRARAMVGGRTYLRHLRRDLGIRMLYRRSGYGVRVGIIVMVWLASAATFYASFADTLRQPDVVARGGVATACVAMAAGFLGTLLAIPTGSERKFDVDDEGTVIG